MEICICINNPNKVSFDQNICIYVYFTGHKVNLNFNLKMWSRSFVAHRKKKRAVKMMVTIVLLFTICWAPFHTVHMLFEYCKQPATTTQPI